MNHTTENSLIVAALLIVIAVPVYLAVRNARNQKKKKLSLLLAKTEADNKLSLQLTDQLDSFTIAIDEEKKMLVQLKEEQTNLIDLQPIVNCQLLEKKQGSSVHTIELLLLDKNHQIKHRLAFYQQYQDNEMNLKRTAKTAAQWEIIIKRTIRQAA